MSDWLPDIIKHHHLDHEDAPDSIRLGKPATAEAIRAFEKSSGRTLPAEFHELFLNN